MYSTAKIELIPPNFVDVCSSFSFSSFHFWTNESFCPNGCEGTACYVVAIKIVSWNENVNSITVGSLSLSLSLSFICLWFSGIASNFYFGEFAYLC